MRFGTHGRLKQKIPWQRFWNHSHSEDDDDYDARTSCKHVIFEKHRTQLCTLRYTAPRTCILTLSKRYIISTTTYARSIKYDLERCMHRACTLLCIYYHNSRRTKTLFGAPQRCSHWNERRKTNDISLLMHRVRPPPPLVVLVQLVPRVADVTDIVLPNETSRVRRPPKVPAEGGDTSNAVTVERTACVKPGLTDNNAHSDYACSDHRGGFQKYEKNTITGPCFRPPPRSF